MRKIFLIVALASSICVFGQNLNPTVTVSNRYNSEMSDFKMQVGKTLVPDSLYRFDLNFNYSGFDVQYQGNDSFNPIRTELDISPRSYDGKRFSMTAAVGYALPVFVDMNAVIKQQGRFKLGFYANNDSFWGKYDRILPYDGGYLRPDAMKLKGFDSRTNIGFDSRVDWKKSYLLLDLKYGGLHSNIMDSGAKNMYNSLSVSGKYRLRGDTFRMGLDASYILGGYEGGIGTSVLTMLENRYRADLSLSLFVKKIHLVDIEASFKMTDAFGANVRGASFGGYTITASPMYFYNGKENVCFGLGFSLFHGASIANVDTGSEWTAFPRLKARWKLVKDYLVMYADASLDGEVWGLGSNSKENLFYVPDAQKTIVKNYDADLGFMGNIAKRFHYKFYGGYSNVQGAPLCVVTANSSFGGPFTSIYHEKNLRSVNAGAALWYRFGSFTLDADMLYRYYTESARLTAYPSWLTASVDLRYEYRSRFWIYAGAEYKSDYKAGEYKVPYFVDLKAGLGFNVRKSLAVFVDGRNLLNYSCQNVPLYSRGGFEILAGVKLLY